MRLYSWRIYFEGGTNYTTQAKTRKLAVDYAVQDRRSLGLPAVVIHVERV